MLVFQVIAEVPDGLASMLVFAHDKAEAIDRATDQLQHQFDASKVTDAAPLQDAMRKFQNPIHH